LAAATLGSDIGSRSAKRWRTSVAFAPSMRRAIEVDPRPDDMRMLAVLLLVHHDHARLAAQSQGLLQLVDGVHALLVGQALVATGIDRAVIEGLRGPGAAGHGFHLAQGREYLLGDRAAYLLHFDAFVGVLTGDVLGEAERAPAGGPLIDHGRAPA
jgi:hypothetical protein